MNCAIYVRAQDPERQLSECRRRAGALGDVVTFELIDHPVAGNDAAMSAFSRLTSIVRRGAVRRVIIHSKHSLRAPRHQVEALFRAAEERRIEIRFAQPEYPVCLVPSWSIEIYDPATGDVSSEDGWTATVTPRA